MKNDKRGLVKFFVILFICIAVIFLIIPFNLKKESPILQGTYTCDQLPFSSIVFDLDDNYTFYYNDYYGADKGTYSKGTGEEHVINSSKFHNTKVLYDEKKRSFEIMIDGGTYLFKQIDRLPVIKVEKE